MAIEQKLESICEFDQELQSAPEICVFMTVWGGLHALGELQTDFREEKIAGKHYYKRTNAWLVQLAEVADVTHRFGVLLPSCVEPNYKKRAKRLEDAFLKVDFSPSFWRWFNWWDDYVKGLPTIERKHIYHLAMERVSTVDSYRPSGDWMNYRFDPALVLFQN